MTPTPYPTISDPDQQSIHDLVSRAQEAQNDPEDLLALHVSEAVIVNLAGRRVLGRDAFGEAMVVALASPLSDVRTTVDVVDVRLATGDTAIVSCLKTVHDGRSATDASTALPSTGALTYVLTRAGASWRIALAQTTPILAATADNG